jgi:hypothetical protein
LRYISTVVLRTDARHEKFSQDSLNTGLPIPDTKTTYPNASSDRCIANPCLVAHERGPSNCRTVAFVTEELLPVILSFSIIQWQFLIASYSGALVKPTTKVCSKFPVLFVRHWQEQAIPVRTHKIWLPIARTSSPTILPLLMSHIK